jgi:succinate dehydrogenase flavin-adding protein (antitoxin of CptAB toxin-antitoxin module)
MLGSFAETSLTSFDSAQPDRSEALLDFADADWFDWITGRSKPHDVMRLLRSRYRQKKPRPSGGHTRHASPWRASN